MASLTNIFGISLGVLITVLIISIPLSLFIIWVMNKRIKRNALNESMKGGFKFNEIKEKQGQYDSFRKDRRRRFDDIKGGHSTRNGGDGGRGIKEYVEQQWRIPLSKDIIHSQDTRTINRVKPNIKRNWYKFE